MRYKLHSLLLSLLLPLLLLQQVNAAHVHENLIENPDCHFCVQSGTSDNAISASPLPQIENTRSEQSITRAISSESNRPSIYHSRAPPIPLTDH